jgi:hypothetical protein
LANSAIQDQVRARVSTQADLDRVWEDLLANDPPTTMAALSGALKTDGVAAPITVDGDEASIVVLSPDDCAIPERMPGTTPASGRRACTSTAAWR